MSLTKLACLPKSEDTSLLRTLYVSRKLQDCNVLEYIPWPQIKNLDLFEDIYVGQKCRLEGLIIR